MSITPVGGVTSAHSHVPAAQHKPEGAELSGAPDHDGDGDDAARAQAPARSAALSPGGVNLKA